MKKTIIGLLLFNIHTLANAYVYVHKVHCLQNNTNKYELTLTQKKSWFNGLSYTFAIKQNGNPVTSGSFTRYDHFEFASETQFNFAELSDKESFTLNGPIDSIVNAGEYVGSGYIFTYFPTRGWKPAPSVEINFDKCKYTTINDT